MEIPRRLLAGALAAALAADALAIVAPDITLLELQNRLKREAEEKIQRDVLDPILGKGRATAFVEIEMEVKIVREESTRAGMGLAERYREKVGIGGSAEPAFLMPGIPKPRTVSSGGASAAKPESVRAQQSQQMKGAEEERFAVTPQFKRLQVTVLHDESVLADDAQKKIVRDRIVDAMGHYRITPDQVAFRPTRFTSAQEAKPRTLKEELRRPEVWLPLLFASLLMLLLLWLFGPLASFFRQYVQALREKPGAEVNIEQKEEEKKEEPAAAGGPLGPSSGDLDITFEQKPYEEPPPPDEEDDMAKKFVPFTYINEENLNRLAYLFMLRREEPWVIALVCYYLRPDFAKHVLASLPADLQARVAVEALTVRQVTREQLAAIDADIKESVDFVVGGLERITALLEEAEPSTRANILAYLKNEKPQVYERVRKLVLTFEDIAGFPDRDMQTLVRELKTESMARALQNAPPEVVNKFLANMSAGAASLLKEAMEYARGLTAAQIDDERAKVLEQVKVLEKEGKITVRDRGVEAIAIDGMYEEVGAQERRMKRFGGAAKGGEAPAPAADPAQAQAYFESAVAQHDAGNLEAALPYFEEALRQDPGLWQARQYLGSILYQLGRVPEAVAHYEKLLKTNPDPQLQAWVDGLKAQVG